MALNKTFRNVKHMKDYGASLVWPQPPKALTATAKKFQSLYLRWRGYQVIKRIPPEDRDMVRRKIRAYDLLAGARRDWGVSRRWYGDYLSQDRSDPIYASALAEVRAKDGGNNIIFSCQVLKLNHFSKTADRLLIMSETSFYKVDPRKGKIMRSERISDIVSVSCGSGSHQLVIIHMRDKKDLVFSLIGPSGEDRVGELVALIATAKRDGLKVTVKDEMHCYMGGKSKTILAQQEASVTTERFDKMASGSGFIFSCPA